MCAAGGSGGEPDDELDSLMDKYAAQADRDLRAVVNKVERPRKRAKTVAAERLEAGLAVPLAADNKGFQMLARMGYTPGHGIGAAADGRSEPVGVEVKQNKLGLGAINKAAARREAQRQQAAACDAQREVAQQRAEEQLQGERAGHRQRAAGQFAARLAAGHLRAALAACLALDEQAGVASNAMWRRELDDAALGQAEAVDDQAVAWEALDVKEQLAAVVDYLRTRYFYCIHCAVKFTDAADLEASCPGPTHADH